MESNLLNIISIISTFQAFLFAFYLLSNNPRQNLSNYFMSIFLIAYGIDFAAYYTSYYVYPVAPNLGLSLSMTLYLAPPALFLYIKSSLYKDFKLRRSDFLHLLPFVLMNLVFIPFYYWPDIKPVLVFSDTESFFFNIVIPFNYISLHVLGISYLIAAYVILRKYKKLYLENFSNAEANKYIYLLQLIVIIGIVDLFSVIKNFAMFNRYIVLYDYTLVIVNLFALMMICWIVFKALKSPELFSGVDSGIKSVRDLIKESKKNKSFPEKADGLQSNEAIQKLKGYMEEASPYLDASLSLDSLANKLNIASKELSVLINYTMGLHFFDFVNEYRINHARNLLSDKSQKDLTVLEILYEVGFNSKSSFNTEFKKRTGSTPTEFRRNYS